MSVEDILIFASQQVCSDIHIRPGKLPVVRKDGRLLPVQGVHPTSHDDVRSFLDRFMTDRHRDTLRESLNVDLPVAIQGVGRFRVNAFYAQGGQSICARVINSSIPDFKTLNLPPVLEQIAAYQRGLVLVTGTTGSGKSTTLASLIDFINQRSARHLLTIEDPIEFVFQEKRCIVNQREIGVDASSFSDAVRAAMREDPDTILVGEMRDRETIEAALSAAETGHMVLSTMHTADAKEVVNRIVIAFPPHQQKEIRFQLASSLKAVISMRLVQRSKDGRAAGRIPACEILIVTPLVREVLADEFRIHELPDIMDKNYETYGMQTFDRSLMTHYGNGDITYETMMDSATNPSDLKLKVEGIG